MRRLGIFGRARSFVRKAVQPTANAATTWRASGVLRDRSVLTLSVERVGEVFDVQNGHRFLLNSSIMEELSANGQGRCWRQQTSASVCGHIVPASSESFLSPFP